MLDKAIEQVIAGKILDFDTAMALVQQTNPTDLLQAADHIRRKLHNNRLDLCSIVNAKSGKCSEDCKFCAQSSHYDVVGAGYDMVDKEKAILLAKENEQYGVQRFSLVTAGRTVTEKDLFEFNILYGQLRQKTHLSFCASMGFLTQEKAVQLKAMGVTRYHCNLETSRSYFPKVCSTHSWEEKVATIRIAQSIGLEVCSGGIIGIGENLAQRLELAFELRDLGVLSIPLNILIPIPGTPFSDLPPLSLYDVLTCVAMFRFINPRAIIRIAGGRNLLGDQQHRCFTSGANGSIVGNYLTTIGNSLAEDIAMFKSLGFDLTEVDRPKE